VLSSAEKRNAYTLMLEKVQAEGERSIVRVLDEVLRRDVPGYATSVRRMEVAERLSASDKIGLFGERIGDHWKPVKDEVAKTPNDKRRDFRAKGDLLDPERKH